MCIRDRLKAFPEEGITGVMPGSTVSKIVSIRNTGRSDAWIRVRVSIEVKDGEGLPLDTGVVGFTVEGPWFNGEDGYYYYSEAVPAERETQVLFREVRFDPDMGNEYQNCTAYIKIEAEAVQTLSLIHIYGDFGPGRRIAVGTESKEGPKTGPWRRRPP